VLQNCNDYNVIDFAIDFSGCTNSLDSIEFLTQVKYLTVIANKLNTPYELFDGSTSTLDTNMKTQIFDILNDTGIRKILQFIIMVQFQVILTMVLVLYLQHETNVFGVNSVEFNN
jgi:ABC-type arginine transport system ATPase subunit